MFLQRRMRTLLLLAGLVALVFSACDDGKNNIIDVADGSSGDLAISVTGIQAQTYDSSGKPSCKNNNADVLLPGAIKIVRGQVQVKEKVDLNEATALLTLKKNSILIGTLCDHGKSKNVLIPDEDCHLGDLCNLFGPDLCNLFETVGTHDIAELESLLGFNGTITLPSLDSAIEAILSGPWQAAFDFQIGGKSVANFVIPSNEQWMQIA